MAPVLVAFAGAAALVAVGDLRAEPLASIGILVAWGAAVALLPAPVGGARRVLVAALALRAVLLLVPPSLSDDVWRYAWEGKLVLAGGNPYLTPPSAFADPAALRVNHPEVSTIYPPLALVGFAALAAVREGPLPFQVFMGACDALTAYALACGLARRGRTLEGAWLYALHPLGAVESASSAHLDAAAVLCLVLAADRASAGLAALGGLVKLWPAVLVPWVWSRRPWAFAGVLILGLLALAPFVDAGPVLARGLGVYAGAWAFNASLFRILDALAGPIARPIALGLLCCVLAWTWRSRRDPAAAAMWAGGALVLLSPVVHPWYVAWAWVPALLCGVRAWTVLATLAPISYHALTRYDPATGAWKEAGWPWLVEYLPFLGALLWEWYRARLRTRRSASGPVPIPSPPASPT